MVYSMTLMVTMLACASIAVDWGHAQVAKTQLVAATDASARAGAAGLSRSPSEALDRARWTALQTPVEAGGLVVQNGDVSFGTWDTTRNTFTVLTGTSQSNANAVRVIGRLNGSRQTAVPLTFASIFGRNSIDITHTSIAMFVRPVDVNQSVPGTANPFLAGMPKGSIASVNNPHRSPDYAGDASDWRQSPLAVNMPISQGVRLSFDSIDGVVRHDPNLADYNPDGQLNSIGTNTAGSENGIGDVRAPINALVGVFLSDAAPNTSAAPESLDFSTAASRDFQVLEPKLKQIFFIGDGRDSLGRPQQFVVPRGATRLYLATWDFFEWNNNQGSRTVKVYRPEQIITVQ
jgi:hypothetical protein